MLWVKGINGILEQVLAAQALAKELSSEALSISCKLESAGVEIYGLRTFIDKRKQQAVLFLNPDQLDSGPPNKITDAVRAVYKTLSLKV